MSNEIKDKYLRKSMTIEWIEHYFWILLVSDDIVTVINNAISTNYIIVETIDPD